MFLAGLNVKKTLFFSVFFRYILKIAQRTLCDDLLRKHDALQRLGPCGLALRRERNPYMGEEALY